VCVSIHIGKNLPAKRRSLLSVCVNFFSRIRVVGLLLFGLEPIFATLGFSQLPAFPTAREPVTNSYHGVAVVDDYQWLEDAANRQSGRRRVCA
jgi:hypothetical protein